MQVDEQLSGCHARSWDESDETLMIERSFEEGEFEMDKQVKPETKVKNAINLALGWYRMQNGRDLLQEKNEKFEREYRHSRIRVKVGGSTRFSFGQARYEGPEGTWLCWLRRDNSQTSGKAWKVSDEQPVFGFYEDLECIGARSDEEIQEIVLHPEKELIHKALSGLITLIRRESNHELHFEVERRDEHEKLLHHGHYYSIQSLRESESLDLSNFRIADKYEYQEAQ